MRLFNNRTSMNRVEYFFIFCLNPVFGNSFDSCKTWHKKELLQQLFNDLKLKQNFKILFQTRHKKLPNRSYIS